MIYAHSNIRHQPRVLFGTHDSCCFAVEGLCNCTTAWPRMQRELFARRRGKRQNYAIQLGDSELQVGNLVVLKVISTSFNLRKRMDLWSIQTFEKLTEWSTLANRVLEKNQVSRRLAI